MWREVLALGAARKSLEGLGQRSREAGSIPGVEGIRTQNEVDSGCGVAGVGGPSRKQVVLRALTQCGPCS